MFEPRIVAALFVVIALAVVGCSGTDALPATATAKCVNTHPAKPFGLKSADLRLNEDGLSVTWTTTSPRPPGGTVLFTVYARAIDGSGDGSARMLGVEYFDGQPESFVFDFDAAKQRNYQGVAYPRGNSVRFTFPRKELKPLGSPFRWKAVLNVAGNDVDACPLPDTLTTGFLRFPA